MKVLNPTQTLPQDLNKLGSYIRPTRPIHFRIGSAVEIRISVALMTIAAIAMLAVVLYMVVDVANGGVQLPLMGGLVSLPNFLKKSGKDNRKRESKPNFKIIADMGQGEKLPSRRQLAMEDEERQWEKYPARMIVRELVGGAA